MATELTLLELVEEIGDLAEQATPEDARSALLYCRKQLKIAVAAKRQDDKNF